MSFTSFMWFLVGIVAGITIYYYIDLFSGKLNKNSKNLNNK